MSRVSIVLSSPKSKYLLIAAAILIVALAVNTIHAAQSCNQGYANDCLYVPDNIVDFTVSPNQNISYTDVTGNPRTFSWAMREPVGVDGPMPIVIWMHGGSGGKNNGLYSLEEWSDLTASMGYFTISVAHHKRDPLEKEALCTHSNLVIPDECDDLKDLNFDRPKDIRVLLDVLDQMVQTPEWEDRLDTSLIAVAGHSAGAGGAMMVAGATRSFGGAPVLIDDPKPIAFMAFSLQGPGTDGFFDKDSGQPETSWMNIDRPMLMGTGAGDNSCKPNRFYCERGDSPSNRKAPFDLMPDGDKYRMFIDDSDTFHTMFELKSQNCPSKGVDPLKCQDFTDWLSSAAAAFLDAHLRDDAFARLWLLSNNLERAGNGSVEWSTK